jgi:hypothetical protein
MNLYTVQFFDYRWNQKGNLTTEYVNAKRLAAMKRMSQVKIEIISVLDPEDNVVFESTGEGNYYN